MRNIGLVLGKELRSYIDSPIAYIFIVLMLLLTGVYFAATLFVENEASLRSLGEVVPLLLMFFVPAITMRLIAEEKRSGTFEVLATKAIRTGEIVLGKFLAASTLVALALVPTLFHAILVALLGPADAGPIVTGMLGLLLFGVAYAAIGVMGSACSQNQIVAYIISFVIGMVLFVVDRVLIYVPLGMVSFVEYIGSASHLPAFVRGVIDSRDVVYFLSVTVFFLMLATVLAGTETPKAVWKLRELDWREQTLRVVLLIGVLFFVNIISLAYFVRMDFTATGAYTLAQPTREVIESLDDNVLVTAYLTPGLPPPYHKHRREIQELLDEYRSRSRGRFHYQFVNPLESPALEEQALQDGVTPVQVKVIRNDRVLTEKAYVGLNLVYGDGSQNVPLVSSLETLEYELSLRLHKLMTRRTMTVAFLAGHGIDAEELRALRSALARVHNVTAVDLSRPIPQEVSALLVVAPRRRFTDPEKLVLDQYIMAGGRVAFFVNTVVPTDDMRKAYHVDLNLDDMFDMYGWVINQDLVVDARSGSIGGVGSAGTVVYPFFPIAGEHSPALRTVRSFVPVTFRFVSSIDVRLAAARGANAEVVLSSSNRSRRLQGDEYTIDPSQTFPVEQFSEQAIPLAATLEGQFRSLFARRQAQAASASASEVATQTSGEGGGTSSLLRLSPPTRIAVAGDGDFVLDRFLQGQENVRFAVSVVDWLLDNKGLTSIPHREPAARFLDEVSAGTKTLVKYVGILVPPSLVVLLGLARMGTKAARRRKHTHMF